MTGVAKVDPSIRRGAVSVPHGHHGANVNLLTDKDDIDTDHRDGALRRRPRHRDPRLIPRTLCTTPPFLADPRGKVGDMSTTVVVGNPKLGSRTRQAGELVVERLTGVAAGHRDRGGRAGARAARLG